MKANNKPTKVRIIPTKANSTSLLQGVITLESVSCIFSDDKV